MGFADELKKIKRKLTSAKKEAGAEPDMVEMREAGISIQRGDPRLKRGINSGNMTPAEREKLRKYRQSR